jgi:hypothetical protein
MSRRSRPRRSTAAACSGVRHCAAPPFCASGAIELYGKFLRVDGTEFPSPRAFMKNFFIRPENFFERLPSRSPMPHPGPLAALQKSFAR